MFKNLHASIRFRQSESAKPPLFHFAGLKTLAADIEPWIVWIRG